MKSLALSSSSRYIIRSDPLAHVPDEPSSPAPAGQSGSSKSKHEFGTATSDETHP